MANLVKVNPENTFAGNLNTLINQSSLIEILIGKLPIYRNNISSRLKGIEIGMAHGYFLIGPFATLGPVRTSQIINLSSCLSAFALILILGLALKLYGIVLFTNKNQTGISISEKDYNKFVAGFIFGAFGGNFLSFLLLNI